jgi:hypothetical protein
MLVKLSLLVLLVVFFQPGVQTVKQPDPCKTKVDDARKVAADTCEGKIQKLRNDYEEKLKRVGNNPDGRSKPPNCEAIIEPLRNELKEYKTRLNICNNQLETNRTCCDQVQAYKTELANQGKTHSAELTKLSEDSQDKYAALLSRFDAKTDDFNKLNKQNTTLLAAVKNFEKISGNNTPGKAELINKAQIIETESEKITAEPKTAVEPLSFYPTETLKTLINADDVTNENSNDVSTKYKDTSAQYKTVIADGEKYQVRELMIGSLYFPDPSALLVEPKEKMEIVVIFKPNALLKNSTADEKTKWFLEFNFAPNNIKDFIYDKARSQGDLRRLVANQSEYLWIWTVEKNKIPSGFSLDMPYIQIDGSVEIAGEELVKKPIENHKLEIKEKLVPGLLASIAGFIKDNLIAILAIATATFGFGAAYLGYQKSKIEKEMKEKESGVKAAEDSDTSQTNSGADKNIPPPPVSPAKEK